MIITHNRYFISPKLYFIIFSLIISIILYAAIRLPKFITFTPKKPVIPTVWAGTMIPTRYIKRLCPSVRLSLFFFVKIGGLFRRTAGHADSHRESGMQKICTIGRSRELFYLRRKVLTRQLAGHKPCFRVIGEPLKRAIVPDIRCSKAFGIHGIQEDFPLILIGENDFPHPASGFHFLVGGMTLHLRSSFFVLFVPVENRTTPIRISCQEKIAIKKNIFS